MRMPSFLASVALTASCFAQARGTWTVRSETGPTAQYGHAMAFDAARGNVVLVGGAIDIDGKVRGVPETWTYADGVWTLRDENCVCGGGPIAYDSDRNLVVLYRGPWSGAGHLLLWNGESWAASPIAPGPGAASAMVYDDARNQLVLFEDATAQTWLFDGAVWTRRIVPGPSPRHGAAMAYHRARGRTVLFGGRRTADHRTAMGETWEWDGMSWRRIEVAGPLPRSQAVMVYDSARSRVVLYGGTGPNAYGYRFSDTWEYDGAAWVHAADRGVERFTDTGETPMFDARLAFDESRGKTVATGGYDVKIFNLHSRTHEWAGPGPCLPPRITRPPAAATVAPGGAITFSFEASGEGPFTYRWQEYNGDLIEGPNIVGTTTPTLTLSRLRFRSTPRFIGVRVSNACGSDEAYCRLDVRCVADVGTWDPFRPPDDGVTIEDLLLYLELHRLRTFSADLDDGSGLGMPDGVVTNDDLLYYLVRFGEGC